MEDARIRELERALWRGEGDIYRRHMADNCIVVVPSEPFLLTGDQARSAFENTPHWEDVDIAELAIHRAQEGLIVAGYLAHATRGEERFAAYCTTTYRRRGEHDWEVIQHQQTLPFTSASALDQGEVRAMDEAQSDAAEERATEGGYQ